MTADDVKKVRETFLSGKLPGFIEVDDLCDMALLAIEAKELLEDAYDKGDMRSRWDELAEDLVKRMENCT